jgi:hypothetical protein
MEETASASGGKHTLEMGVANTGFIIDRLGRDCAPLQYLRELTQNSIEAILDTPEKSGDIVWDVDWNQYDLTGAFKLSIIDGGVGMTGPEMIEYINHLSSSKREQAHDKNFGVGAKVAAATRNHAGLVYLSWKDGRGYMTHLWRDPDTEQYGLARAEREDGTFHDYLPISEDVKPTAIGEHGTMVVLLGMVDEQNTMEPPEGVEGRQRWISKYLNTRYFTFPQGIEVKVREGYQAPRDDSRRNFLRKVTGQKAFLDHESDWYGTVELTDATAHVWVLNDRPERTKLGDMFAATGHMAALYHDELYELVTGRAGVARLQLFGVIFGHSRVAIYVEPSNDARLSSNTARTQLLVDGDPLPWAEWAAEFREKMPEEIKALMEEITAGASTNDHRAAIKERLRAVRDLFKVSRYRPTSAGKLHVVEETAGGSPRESEAERGKAARSSGGRGGRAGGIYALFVDDDGDPGEEVQADVDPIVHWISVTNGTRTPDLLEDRAAKYLPDQNILQVNADFRVFTDMITRWTERYADMPGAADVVEEVIHEWFEQALVETVLGAQALQGSPQWTFEDIGRLWSEEGLTAAVLQRYHVEVNARRSLGTRLGSLKEKTAVA